MNCSACGEPVEMGEDITPDELSRAARIADLVICSICGAVFIIDRQLVLRPLAEDQFDLLPERSQKMIVQFRAMRKRFLDG